MRHYFYKWRILLGILVVSQNASATNYFNWGVESETTSNGPIYGYFSGSSRDCASGVAHTGSCAMKSVIIGVDSGNQSRGADLDQLPLSSRNVVGSGSLYYRWWMKIMPGFSWGNGSAKTKSSRVLGGTYSRVYTGYVQASGFNIGECDDVGPNQPGGGCVDPGPSIAYNMRSKNDGIWHEYIVRVEPNSSPTTPDAEFQVWVDGVSVGQVNNWRLHQYAGNSFIEGWGGWMVTQYFQLNGTTSDGGTIYVDDISTDDTYNSLIGGGGETPPTPTLSAPKNLRII